MPYNNIEPGQHWHNKWFAAWSKKAIIVTNVILSSVRSSEINLGPMLHDASAINYKNYLKIDYLNLI